MFIRSQLKSKVNKC